MDSKTHGRNRGCQVILYRCLAIHLCKTGHNPDDFWMYDSGYMIFQNFLSANSQCWWNNRLRAATKIIKYAGHVAPGILLITGEPWALEVIRGTFARGVLKPPPTFVISSVGDINECLITPTLQGQFTPLPEALCYIILDLTKKGQYATVENLRLNLKVLFPHMTTPQTEIIYDTLVQLMQEKKIYQTSKGYFIITPERNRSKSALKFQAIDNLPYNELENSIEGTKSHESRTILMTNSEALYSLYGEISTERDGDLTHQCIQTNLADVICGGNPNDKVMYPRKFKNRSSSFHTCRSLERRHSLRFFGSSKRIQRFGSTRSLSKTYAQSLANDSSSSEYQSTDSTSTRKGSLLHRLFRRSRRSKARHGDIYPEQFPPIDWFNSRTISLHSVGTQTIKNDAPVLESISKSTFYDGLLLNGKSLSIPRETRRNLSTNSSCAKSNDDCTASSHNFYSYSSCSLPRSVKPKLSNLNRKIQQSSNISFRNTKISQTQEKVSNNLNANSFETKMLETNKNHKSTIPSQSCFSRNSYITKGGNYFSNLLNRSPNLIANKSHKSSLDFWTDIGSIKSDEVVENSTYLIGNNEKINIQNLTASSNSIPKSPYMIRQKPKNSQLNKSKTKIIVRNSPIQSIITLENTKLPENLNYYIVNKETTTKNGELIKKQYSLKNDRSFVSKVQMGENTTFGKEKEFNVYKNSPFLSKNNQHQNEINRIQKESCSSELLGKGNYNSSNHSSTKLPQKSCRGYIYQNYMTNDSSVLTDFEGRIDCETRNFNNDCGYHNKRLGKFNNELKSNTELKNLKLESINKYKSYSFKSESFDSLSSILHKNKIFIGSQPDLVIKNDSLKIEQKNKNYSIHSSKNDIQQNDFPSLTNLGFNFRSLAANKILQGAGLKSYEHFLDLDFSDKDNLEN